MIDLHYWTTPNGHKVTQPCNRRSKKPNDGGKPISVFRVGHYTARTVAGRAQIVSNQRTFGRRADRRCRSGGVLSAIT